MILLPTSNRQRLGNERVCAPLTMIMMIQKVHRQPIDPDTKPPIMGPKTLKERQCHDDMREVMPPTGPRSGPRKNRDIILPR